MYGSNMSVTFLDQIVEFTGTLGKIPKPISDARASYRKVAEKTRTMFGKPADLNEAILDAVMSDRDPASDPVVQRVVTAQIIGREGVAQELIHTALYRYADQLAAYGDVLIEAWRKPFDEAAETIRKTAKTLGNRSLDDARDVLSRGGDIAEAWVRANNANLTIKEIVGKWNMLTVQTNLVPSTTQMVPLRFLDPTLEQWETLGLRERKLDAWTAHREGVTLSLASPTDYMDRQARLEQARGRREQSYIENMKLPGFAEFNEKVKAAEKSEAKKVRPVAVI